MIKTKELLYVSIFLFASCSALFNPFRGTISGDTLTYNSDSLDLTVTAPLHWRFGKGYGDSSWVPVLPRYDQFVTLSILNSKNNRAVIRILSSAKPVNMKAFFRTIETGSDRSSLTGAFWVLAGNDSAAVIEYRKEFEGGQPCLIREFCFIQKSHVLRLQCAAVATAFADYEPDFSAVIRNIKFVAAGADLNENRWRSTSIAASDHSIGLATTTSSYNSTVTYDAVCPDTNKSTFWKVASSTAVVYILGSIHVAKPEIYPLKQAITNAFDSSDALVLEINPHSSEAQSAMNRFSSKVLYPGMQSIEEHVSYSLAMQIKLMCGKLDLSYFTYRRFQPWILSMTLTMAQMKKIGIDKEYGIEEHFLSLAEQKGKTILQLETAFSQLTMLYENCNVPLFLEYTLDDLSNAEQSIVPLIGAWKCGNTEYIEQLVIGQNVRNRPEYEMFIEKLIFERNRQFVGKVEEYLKGRQTYFVICGCGHTVGEKGIVRLLASKGYSVDQL